MPSPFSHTAATDGHAETIKAAYASYRERFNQLTAGFATCFRERKWPESRRIARERLDVYSIFVKQTVATLFGFHQSAERSDAEAFWATVKNHYTTLIHDHQDCELAETFFNSIVRRVFNTSSVNDRIEFTTEDFRIPSIEDRYCPICKVFRGDERYYFKPELIRNIFDYYRQTFNFINLENAESRTSRHIESSLLKRYGSLRIQHIEMIESPFYRGRAAYLIGRIRTGSNIVPLVIALHNEGEGVEVDAVLLSESEVSILFSFARSYFHVMVEQPTELVNFLKTILPRKRISEIFIALGFDKHAKAELYRELSRTLVSTREQFKFAYGEKGMVMTVFTLPSFNVVFKVIKDRFKYPKQTTAESVRKKYRMVFYHGRAGRMPDAQEFHNLIFDKNLFHETVLAELTREAGSNVVVMGEQVVIKHVYIERRVTPLDVYLNSARGKAAAAAIVDYGQAIKDLAAGHMFTGDLFLKNFGVTRHGRVVFYDYDEICPLTECRFRRIPEPRNDMEALSDTPWYYVGEGDVFPEEFRTFLTFPNNTLRDVFEKHHGNLFDVAFWQSMQDKLKRGAYVHIYPYDPRKRFKAD